MDNKPQIPTLKESQNKPQLKIKGLASGLSLIERLKQFKKKDLAFILAGLGVLFMAPLAEHFMMAPEGGGDGALGQGFGNHGPNGSLGFTDKSITPYETGGGLAPGGPAGSGSDVITPLNVRDPSALVMGPGATQQPAAAASAPLTAPPPPPPAKEDSKWNDAISAGKAAASTAVKKAALPVPRVSLSAGGLRGLGAVSGGSGSSFSAPPISSNGLAPKGAAGSNSLTGTNGSGFKGVARGQATGAGGALDKLKAAAAAQGSDFNRSGPASSALEAAASQNLGGGSGGGAGEGGGAADKATSGSQNKDSKTPGESLEFLRQKEEQQKAIDLKYKKLEAGDMDLERFKIRNKMMEDGASALTTPIFKAFGDFAGSLVTNALPTVGAASKPMACTGMDGKNVVILGGTYATSCFGGTSSKDSGTSLNGKSYCLQGTDVYGVQSGTPQQTKFATGCSVPGADPKPDPKAKGGVDNGMAKVDGGTGKTLGDMCPGLKAGSANMDMGANTPVMKGATGKALKTGESGQLIDADKVLQQAAVGMAAAKLVLTGDKKDYDACVTAGVVYTGGLQKYTADAAANNVRALLDSSKASIANDLGYLRDQVIAKDNSFQQKILPKETSTGNLLADALKEPKAVNAASLTPAHDALGELAANAKGAITLIDAPETGIQASYDAAGHPNQVPWTAISKLMLDADARLTAVDAEIKAAGDKADKGNFDKEPSKQINGEGAKWDKRSGVNKDELKKLQGYYDGATAALGPTGEITLAHANVQAQLRAGSKGGAGADKSLMAMVESDGTAHETGPVDPTKDAYSSRLAKTITALKDPDAKLPLTSAEAIKLQQSVDSGDETATAQWAKLETIITTAQNTVSAAIKEANKTDGVVVPAVSEAGNKITEILGKVGQPVGTVTKILPDATPLPTASTANAKTTVPQ